MQIDCGICLIRSWRRDDAAGLPRHANNPNVARYLRDAFPQPYTARHAADWIGYARTQRPERQFAIQVGGEAVGAIGLELGWDVNRFSAELGYWLSESVWGRGIATAAVQRFAEFCLEEFNLLRLFAVPIADNLASMRVLEKARFQREGLMRASAVKEGRIHDQVLYARLQSPWRHPG